MNETSTDEKADASHEDQAKTLLRIQELASNEKTRRLDAIVTICAIVAGAAGICFWLLLFK